MAFILLFISSSLFAAIDHKSHKDPSSPPIKIITNNWSSQIVLSHITGFIFQQLGYGVQYIPTSISDQWGALAYGAAHVQVEVWEGTMAEIFERHIKAGSILDAGTHDATTREDWWYPEYIEKDCPGLPSWQALKDCASIFSLPDATNDGDNKAKGIYYAGPWEKPDEARIRALNLDFEVIQLASSDALWVELNKAIKNKQPIVLFNWSPNWVNSRIPGSFVEFPDYKLACEQDPSWGINKSFLHDCGNPKGGWLKKASWKGMEKEFPCAFNILKNLNFNNQQLSDITALVDVDNLSYEKAAQQWLSENQQTWSNWIPQECLHE